VLLEINRNIKTIRRRKLEGTFLEKKTINGYFPFKKSTKYQGLENVFFRFSNFLVSFLGHCFFFRFVSDFFFIFSVSLRRVSFRFYSFYFVSFRFVSFRFVSFRFVSFRFVSFRFVSQIFSFRFVSWPFPSDQLYDTYDIT
jgi:hypothetical protein